MAPDAVLFARIRLRSTCDVVTATLLIETVPPTRVQCEGVALGRAPIHQSIAPGIDWHPKQLRARDRRLEQRGQSRFVSREMTGRRAIRNKRIARVRDHSESHLVDL